ncbi:MAG: ASKHA domain-containing protein [Syntrophorhabdaceae bacterium]|nr:ASKHA domain-containing protein [Syntrophorhabdaceae bacterium]
MEKYIQSVKIIFFDLKMDKHRIRFLPLDITYLAQDGENLLDFAMDVGVHINASCGGNGTCKRCKVRLVEGRVDFCQDQALSVSGHGEDIVLACQTRIKGDAVFEIPLESQIDRSALKSRKSPNILSAPDSLASLGGISPDPVAYKINITLEPPGIDNNMADSERLIRVLKNSHNMGDVKINLNILKRLPSLLRNSGWDVTLTIAETDMGLEITDVQVGNTPKKQYALAIDIGTTTVCGQIIDLWDCSKTGSRVIGESADYNAQISYGDDVITRIMHTRKKGGLKRLQEAVVKTINLIIDELTDKAGIERSFISHMVCAGNTTMTHLLLGVEPRYIMISPYTPAFVFPPVIKGGDIGIKGLDNTPLYLFPCVSSYVGGDIVAGVISSGMAKEGDISLFIDIGTNGEIVLGNKDWLMCASCSAGPAFEGGGISHGMRAAKGAIEQVRINKKTYEPMILTIGHSKPLGICGSGLIDSIAEMLSAGIITENGRFNRELPTDRVREGKDGYEYVLCYGKETQTGRDICLTEIDIDNIMRAKAAMFAGCKVLLDSAGLYFNELKRVIIAGGFGHFLDPSKAQIIGLLPELPLERFVFIGNSSLMGASLFALSREYASEAERVARMMTNIELTNNNRFMEEFMAAMFLPHTDLRLFSKTLGVR